MKDDLEGVVRSRRAPAGPLPVASRAAAAATAAAGADWAAVTVCSDPPVRLVDAGRFV